MEKFLLRLQKYFIINKPGYNQMQKGELQPIHIYNECRGARRFVTLITGLEVYGIELEEFARFCAKKYAATATIISAEKKKLFSSWSAICSCARKSYRTNSRVIN